MLFKLFITITNINTTFTTTIIYFYYTIIVNIIINYYTIIVFVIIKVKNDDITVEVKTNGEFKNFIADNMVCDLEGLKMDESVPAQKYIIIGELIKQLRTTTAR